MEIIKDIGSYAGFAAVVGLAVLAALYFSQARDLKRLREWAGRAPDRDPAAPPAAPQRVVAQPIPRPGTPVAKPPVPGARPVPRPPGAPVPPGTPAAPPAAPGAAPGTPAPPAKPGGRPVPAQAAAAGAAPAVAGGGPTAPDTDPETSNGASGDERAAPAEPAAQEDTAIHPSPEPPAPAAEPAAPDAEADAPSEEYEAVSEEFDAAPGEEPAAAAGESGEFKPEDLWEGDTVLEESEAAAPAPAAPPTPPPPSRPAPSLPREPAPAPPAEADAPILPPYDRSRPGGPARTGAGLMSSPRRAVAMVGGTILAAVVLGFAVIQLTGGDDGKQNEPTVNTPQDDTQEQPKNSTPSTGVDPKDVTVAVLNGTTVPGLARELGAKIEQQGFQLGNVTNSGDQQRAESVVLAAPNAEKEAAEVAKRMKIAQREPIDAESQALGGDASVVVIAGQNLTQ